MTDRDAVILPAYVVENEKFLETGEIKIQVSKLKTAMYAEIMTPIGGQPNMAMHWVPPVGTSGYVLYKFGDERKPVWIGSQLLPWDAAGATNLADADIKQGVVEADDLLADFVIKTQNNTFENQDMDDAEHNKVENILKMSKGEFTLAKVQQNDKYEYKLDHYDVKEEPHYQIISMQDDKIVIKFNSPNEDGEGAVFTLTEGKVDLVTQYGDTTCTLSMTENGITTDVNGKTSITIDKDGNTHVSCKKMVVDADAIELGGNDDKAVLLSPLRDFINQTYMSHTHPTPSGPSGPPAPTRVNLASKKVKLS